MMSIGAYGVISCKCIAGVNTLMTGLRVQLVLWWHILIYWWYIYLIQIVYLILITALRGVCISRINISACASNVGSSWLENGTLARPKVIGYINCTRHLADIIWQCTTPKSLIREDNIWYDFFIIYPLISEREALKFHNICLQMSKSF